MVKDNKITYEPFGNFWSLKKPLILRLREFLVTDSGTILFGITIPKRFMFDLENWSLRWADFKVFLSLKYLRVSLDIVMRSFLNVYNYGQRTALPFALLDARTALPAAVFILERNPWVLFLLILLGWNVLFIDLYSDSIITLCQYINSCFFVT